MIKGTLYGIGVGPGDPELLTLKAIKAIHDCDVLTVPDSSAENKIARSIVHEYIVTKTVLHLELPMTCDKFELKKSREIAADTICAKLDTGKSVGFLTLGDPMLYSTYSYLHKLITARGYPAIVIPGVTSFCAAAAALGEPLCEGGESLHIIPALYDNIENILSLDGTKVLMKSGSKLIDIVNHLKEKEIEAKMAQRVSMDGERLYRDLSGDMDTDYFSILIVKDKGTGSLSCCSNVAASPPRVPPTEPDD